MWGDGIPVYPGGFDGFGADVLTGHAGHFKADLVLVLGDAFAQNEAVLAGLNTAVWAPVDCDPLGALDRNSLRASGARVIAMSRHGEKMLDQAGFVPLYAPHGIDTQIFKPGNRKKCRQMLGLPAGAFIIGMNAANKDPLRKGFPEQITAFAALRAQHPGALLLVHSTPLAGTGGIDLTAVCQNLGIQDAVHWADPYSYASGAYSQADMAIWYNCLDLYSGCSYGEGFGLPLIEAQACGVPVVTTDASAMSELAGPGWKVGGEPYWHAAHQSWWAKPRVGEIAAAYEHAWNGGANPRRAPSREFALTYDADQVLTQHWKPILADLESESR